MSSKVNPFKWRHARGRDYSFVCTVVSKVCAQLSGPRRDDARARTAGGSHHNLSLSFSSMLQSWIDDADPI
jgi:hypothetical protein